jgi:hypothetical protein
MEVIRLAQAFEGAIARLSAWQVLAFPRSGSIGMDPVAPGGLAGSSTCEVHSIATYEEADESKQPVL